MRSVELPSEGSAKDWEGFVVGEKEMIIILILNQGTAFSSFLEIRHTANLAIMIFFSSTPNCNRYLC